MIRAALYVRRSFFEHTSYFERRGGAPRPALTRRLNVMASAVETKKVIKGGSFILEDHDASDVFTPDDLSDEHKMIAQTAREFTEKEVMPLDAEIETKDYELTRGLLRKAGELGLLSIDIPEKYGGAGLDLLSSLVASEAMSGQASFSGSLGAHTPGSPMCSACSPRSTARNLLHSSSSAVFQAYRSPKKNTRWACRVLQP